MKDSFKGKDHQQHSMERVILVLIRKMPLQIFLLDHTDNLKALIT